MRALLWLSATFAASAFVAPAARPGRPPAREAAALRLAAGRAALPFAMSAIVDAPQAGTAALEAAKPSPALEPREVLARAPHARAGAGAPRRRGPSDERRPRGRR